MFTSEYNYKSVSTRKFLFFAACVICKKNYSFSRVFLFFLPKIANSFYSKINDSSRIGTTWFSSRFGVRVSVVPNNFMIYPEHFLIPEIKETLKGSPTKFFGTETKNFDGKSWYSLPPPLLSIKFFDTRNFAKHRRVPLRSFSVLWDNKFSIEIRDIPLLGINFFLPETRGIGTKTIP